MAKTQKSKPKVNTIGVELAGLFIKAIEQKLPATAYCIDLAKLALGWELGHGSFSARIHVKERIIKDFKQ